MIEDCMWLKKAGNVYAFFDIRTHDAIGSAEHRSKQDISVHANLRVVCTVYENMNGPI